MKIIFDQLLPSGNFFINWLYLVMFNHLQYSMFINEKNFNNL